jgi:hypothetical protein
MLPQCHVNVFGQILKFLNLKRLKEGDITSFGFIPNGRCKVCQQNGSLLFTLVERLEEGPILLLWVY